MFGRVLTDAPYLTHQELSVASLQAVCLALLMAWASRLQAAASNPSIRHSSTSSTPDPQNEALESSSRSSSSEGSSSGNKPHHIDRAQPPFTDTGQHQPVTAESLSLALAAAAASCASGGALAHALHVPNLSLAFMSVAAVGVAYGTSLARSAWRSRPNDRQLRPSFAGAAQVSSIAFHFIMCTASCFNLNEAEADRFKSFKKSTASMHAGGTGPYGYVLLRDRSKCWLHERLCLPA